MTRTDGVPAQTCCPPRTVGHLRARTSAVADGADPSPPRRREQQQRHPDRTENCQPVVAKAQKFVIHRRQFADAPGTQPRADDGGHRSTHEPTGIPAPRTSGNASSLISRTIHHPRGSRAKYTRFLHCERLQKRSVAVSIERNPVLPPADTSWNRICPSAEAEGITAHGVTFSGRPRARLANSELLHNGMVISAAPTRHARAASNRSLYRGINGAIGAAAPIDGQAQRHPSGMPPRPRGCRRSGPPAIGTAFSVRRIFSSPRR